jgi:hypothetical protein
MNNFLKLTYLAAAISLSAFDANAGSSASSHVGVEKFGAAAIASFAEKVEAELDEREVNVAIIARTGRMDEDLPEGVDYTHVGIAVYEAIRDADGKISYGYTVYNLYQGAGGRKDRSHLVQDFVFDMCAGIAEPKIGVIIPADDLQRKMLKVLRSPLYNQLHNESYNLLANPYNDSFDNCVSHTLEVIVAGMLDTQDADPVRAKINAHFEAQVMKLSLLQEIGVSFMKGATLDDQNPNKVYTATFGSLNRFLKSEGMLKEFVEVYM